MKRASNLAVWLVLIFFGAAGGGCSREEPSIEIPLNKIWAVEMPGTKDVRKLEPIHFGAATRQLPQNEQTKLLISSLKFQIFQAIYNRQKKGEPIGPGFTVAGKGKEALESVHGILKNGVPIPSSISTNAEATLFFYGALNGQYLQLKKVYIEKRQMILQFQLVPHMTMEMTQHFALIPLGKLPIGNYTVTIKQVLTEKEINNPNPMMDASYFQKKRKEWVCQDFQFAVVACTSVK